LLHSASEALAIAEYRSPRNKP